MSLCQGYSGGAPASPDHPSLRFERAWLERGSDLGQRLIDRRLIVGQPLNERWTNIPRMTITQDIQDWVIKQRQNLQFEVQWMTAAGGWKRHKPFQWEGKYGPPESDDDILIVDPGRYREIRRVDGRIHSVLWTYETAEAQAYYEKQKQLELAQNLSKQELLSEARNPDELDQLERIEIIGQLELMLTE